MGELVLTALDDLFHLEVTASPLTSENDPSDLVDGEDERRRGGSVVRASASPTSSQARGFKLPPPVPSASDHRVELQEPVEVPVQVVGEIGELRPELVLA